MQNYSVSHILGREISIQHFSGTGGNTRHEQEDNMWLQSPFLTWLTLKSWVGKAVFASVWPCALLNHLCVSKWFPGWNLNSSCFMQPPAAILIAATTTATTTTRKETLLETGSNQRRPQRRLDQPAENAPESSDGTSVSLNSHVTPSWVGEVLLEPLSLSRPRTWLCCWERGRVHSTPCAPQLGC